MRRSSPPSSDVERDVAQLFALPLAEFTAARNTLAGRLKQDGNAEESARVKGLARPTISAWAVNQVFWRERAAYERLIAAGDALRAAQQRMLTGRQHDLRDTMRDRQEAGRAVVEHAMRFLRESGNAATDATRQRVAVTVDALAAYGSDQQGYAHGRLERDLDPPGLEALGFLSGLAGAARMAATGPAEKTTTDPSPNLRLVRGGATKKPAPTGEDTKAAKARAATERADRERLERERRDREKQQRAAIAVADRELAAAERAFERAVQGERTAAASHHEQQRNAEALRRQLAKAEERLEAAASDLDAARAAREHAEARLAEARGRREALRE